MFREALMRRPSFNSSTLMSGIFVSSLTAARAMKNSSKISCAGNTHPEKSLVRLSRICLYCRRVTVAFVVCPEEDLDAVVYDFCDRRQVTSYVPFTKRLPMVEEFTPEESEDRLYTISSPISSAGKICRRFRPGNERLEALESELRAINPKLQLFSRSLDLRNQDELERFCDWLVQSNLALDCLISSYLKADLTRRKKYGGCCLNRAKICWPDSNGRRLRIQT